MRALLLALSLVACGQSDVPCSRDPGVPPSACLDEPDARRILQGIYGEPYVDPVRVTWRWDECIQQIPGGCVLGEERHCAMKLGWKPGNAFFDATPYAHEFMHCRLEVMGLLDGDPYHTLKGEWQMVLVGAVVLRQAGL